MSFGSIVNNLIKKNIEIWHKDTLVREGAKIPLEEKAKLFLDARILNNNRNELRDDIDREVGHTSYSKKINYHKES